MTTEEILAQMESERERAQTDPQDKFMDDVCNNALYWIKNSRSREDTATGVTFGLLTLIDGCGLSSPPIDLAYRHEVNGEEVPGTVFNDDTHLHDNFYPRLREIAAKTNFPLADPKREQVISSTIATPDLMVDELVEHGTTALMRDDAELWLSRSGNKELARNAARVIVTGLMEDGLIPSAKQLTDEQNVSCLKHRGGLAQRLAAEIIAGQVDESADAVDAAAPETYNNVVPMDQRLGSFVENCANIVDYWSEQADSIPEAAEGVMTSVLTMLDGAGDVPPMDLVPAVVPELVTEYNNDGTAGWPAESINSNISLSESYLEEISRRKRLQAAEALGG